MNMKKAICAGVLAASIMTGATSTEAEKRVVEVEKVMLGENLHTIAKRNNLNIQQLRTLNPGISHLKRGQWVIVKDRGILQDNLYTTHRIEKGDTFYTLGKRYGVSSQTIETLNPSVEDVTKLTIGQAVRVPKKMEDHALVWATLISHDEPNGVFVIETYTKERTKVYYDAKALGYPLHYATDGDALTLVLETNERNQTKIALSIIVGEF